MAVKCASAHQDSLYQTSLFERSGQQEAARALPSGKNAGVSLCHGPVLPNAQGSQARTRGSPFALVNGATALDVLCVYVPDGVIVEKPIHVVYIPTGMSHAHVDPRDVIVHKTDRLCALVSGAIARDVLGVLNPKGLVSEPIHVAHAPTGVSLGLCWSQGELL